jgi:hypothetical protein
MLKYLFGGLARKVRAYFSATIHDKIGDMDEKISVNQHALTNLILNLDTKLNELDHRIRSHLNRSFVSLGNGSALIQTMAGPIVCDCEDIQTIATVMTNATTSGGPAHGVTLLLNKALMPGDTYIDIGASPGLHLVSAAKSMYGRGTILGFEPPGFRLNLLRSTIKMHSLANLVRLVEYLPFGTGSSNQNDVLAELPPTPTTIVRSDRSIGMVDAFKSLEVLFRRDAIWIFPLGIDHQHSVHGSEASKLLAAFESHDLVWRVIHPDTGMIEHWPLARLMAANAAIVVVARPMSHFWKSTGAL